MGRLRQVPKAEAPLEVLQIYRQFFGERDPVAEPGTETGTPGDYWTTFALVPDLVVMAYNTLLPLLQPGRKLDPKLRELVILRTAIVGDSKEEALALGLVHEVVDDALARAKEIAAEIASFSPIAVSRAKRAVYMGSDTHLAAGLDVESSAFLETMLSEDGLLAMKTYISLPYEKRRDWLEKPTSPEYKGK